jgi:LysM repeat protein
VFVMSRGPNNYQARSEACFGPFSMRFSFTMRPLLLLCGTVIASSLLAIAQEKDAGTPATVGDITLIRQILEQQSKQIETLTEQVAVLSQLLKGRQGMAGASIPNPVAVDMPPESSNPGSTIAEQSITVRTATPARQTHTVIKGESFSSIADKYGISVNELLKLNPMSDPRKLQIGQTLRLPIMERQMTPAPLPGAAAAPPSSRNEPPPAENPLINP